MIRDYTQRPTTTTAAHYTATNTEEITAWLNGLNIRAYPGPLGLIIDNPNKPLLARPGDYITHEADGTCRPHKPDVFNTLYVEN